MKSYFLRLFTIALILFQSVASVSHHAFADDAINWEDQSAAMTSWLKSPGNDDFFSTYGSSVYESGMTLYLPVFLAKGEWRVEKRINWAWGGSWPTSFGNFIFTQRPYSEQNLPKGAAYFLEQTVNPEKRIIMISYDSGFYLYSNKKSVSMEELNALRLNITDGIYTDTAYNGGILELKETGMVGFLVGAEKMNSKWDDLILDENVKEPLRKSIDDFLKNYDFQKWSKLGIPLNQGILIDGLPGTGKTFTARIIISNILNKVYGKKITYLHVQARHVHDVYQIRNIYQIARKSNPSVVFFEDIDLIAGTNRADRAQVKNELMQQLSGVEKLEGVMTIGTTNMGEQIDPALKRSKRLGIHFSLGTSSFNERVNLFKLFVESKKAETLDYIKFASLTENMTGADIKQLCLAAVDFAVRDQLTGKSKDPNHATVSNVNMMSALELRKNTTIKGK